ncbi:MAG: hypothetical protein KGY76_00260 [Candidatus Thermoplasmatota archaeon]|nr:hypothetical protein [Candidatus Thermoplasmatota archaeon]
MLRFNKDIEINRFYDPTQDEEQEVKVEIRSDPLTGKTSRILDKPLPIPSDPDMSDVEEYDFCPFCPENIDEVGARDIEVLSRERLEKDEAVLLSNVTPYSKHSLVIRLTEDHFLELDEFDSKHFADAFELAKRYLSRMENHDRKDVPTILMNYLKPAGSSIVHPHLQLLVSKKKMDYQRRMLEEGSEYYDAEGKSYWEDLIREERDGERYIGKTGSWDWLSAHAPRGFEHVKGINLKDFMDLNGEDIKDLSSCIVKVLKAYHDMDYNSFNLSVFIPPLGSDKDRFATVIDMVTRSNLDRFYWSDVFAMPKLMDEPYSNKKPEEVAKSVRKSF